MEDFLLNNWEWISTGLAVIVPALLPAKYATKINLVTRVVKGAYELLDKLDKSKGGLTLKEDKE